MLEVVRPQTFPDKRIQLPGTLESMHSFDNKIVLNARNAEGIGTGTPKSGVKL
jgi:hypothetical protein